MTEEYRKPFIDLTVKKGRVAIKENWAYVVDDLTRLGLWEPKFGWVLCLHVITQNLYGGNGECGG